MRHLSSPSLASEISLVTITGIATQGKNTIAKHNRQSRIEIKCKVFLSRMGVF